MKLNLAPIVLFVYNRPLHTKQTLEALSRNELADESILYVFSDGPKNDASEDDLNSIKEVRSIINERKWCKVVSVVEFESNSGLSNSLIRGISEIIKEYGSVIVLEDDIVTARGFLRYMNEALRIYFDEENVAGISGWGFPIEIKDDTYFSRVGSCWGWATWNRVWKDLNFNGIELIDSIRDRNLVHEFNVDGAYDYFFMLNQQASGKINSWAVRFYANYFLHNGLFLFPNHSLVRNIGFDGSGTNYNTSGSSHVPEVFKKEFVKVEYIDAFEKPQTRRKIIAYFKPSRGGVLSYVRIILSKLRRKNCLK